MAAPAEVTCKNLSGKYVMNASHSDSADAFFALQGLGWFLRKGIQAVTITIDVTQYQKDGVERIDITSNAAGVSRSVEKRVLTWTERDHRDKIFGTVKGKSRIFNKADFEHVGGGPEEEAAFLRGDRLKDGTPSSFVDDVLVQSYAVNLDAGYEWAVEQVWGFEEIDGKRYHTRRFVCRKGEQSELMRFVYDYQGPADKEEVGGDDELAYGE